MNSKINCDVWIRHTSCLMEDMTVAADMALVIKDGKILAVEKEGQNSYEAAETVDGRDRLFLPGLVDCHMHTGQQLLKGAVLDELPMIWTRIMLPFESTLTPEKMKLSASLAALEMIKNGTTGFVESGGYFMEEAGEVYAKSGLRGALSCSGMDKGNLPDSIRQGTEEVLASEERLFERFHGRGNLKVYYSLRALMNCSEALIRESSAEAKRRGTFLQAHMNEYAGEVNYTLEQYRKRPVEYLEELGALGAHCGCPWNPAFGAGTKASGAGRRQGGTLPFQQLRKRSSRYAGASGARCLRRSGDGRSSPWRIKSVE